MTTCPRCGSPDPSRHPAVQHEGEVSICSDPFHSPPKVPFRYDGAHDQGFGVPGRCRCGGSLSLRKLGWTCGSCGAGYGRDD